MPTLPATLQATLTDRGFVSDHVITARMPWPPSLLQERRDGSCLGPTGPVLHFAVDNQVYRQGDHNRSFYKVVSGVVRTCRFQNDGRRQIDAFYISGDVFGFESGAEHRLAAEAVSECSLIAYRRNGMEKLAATNDQVAQQFFSHAMNCLERTQEHSMLLGRRGAVEKLATFLLEMSSRQPGKEVIDLPMTRQDIADYLGLTIETVSRSLSQLERDAVIELPTARRVCLRNRAALHQLIS